MSGPHETDRAHKYLWVVVIDLSVEVSVVNAIRTLIGNIFILHWRNLFIDYKKQIKLSFSTHTLGMELITNKYDSS